MIYDVLIIGAGASGLMAAMTAAARGRQVLIIDHAEKPGKKLAICGGGRINFTNYDIDPRVNYLCDNPHFPISALKRYTQYDFIEFVDQHQLPWEERPGGCLFFTVPSHHLIDTFMAELRHHQVKTKFRCHVQRIEKTTHWQITTDQGLLQANELVIATGGPSIPKIGASAFGYKIAEQFGHRVIPPVAGLVPLVLKEHPFEALSGCSFDATITTNQQTFTGAILITHRGFSGPATLQISSYWQPGTPLHINLFPKTDLEGELIQAKKDQVKSTVLNHLARKQPKRLLRRLAEVFDLDLDRPLKDTPQPLLKAIAARLTAWPITPDGTEGYRTAEVTRGGICVDDISSKTFESRLVPKLYFIGEVLDVTGHLGGYNLQWAWSSGYCCGQHLG